MRVTSAELAQLPFDEVYGWMRQAIYPYLLSLTHNREDAEDTLHDTALAAWQALQKDKLRDKRWLMQYIRNTATYRCWDLIRERVYMRQSEYRYSDETRCPESAFNAKIDLAQMVRSLMPKPRQALLSYETDKVMAEQMQTSVHAVAIMRNRALAQLKNEAAWLV